MPVRVFPDSNVLICSVGDNEPCRQLAEELIAAGGVVSAQVIAETAAVLRRNDDRLTVVNPFAAVRP